MKTRFYITISLLALSMSLKAAGIQDIISALEAIDCWKAAAEFRVSLPQANDDIVYTLNLEQQRAPGDSLLPCNYLIDWTFRPDDPVSGFSAYFSGNHYRYRGQDRLQEYHFADNPAPFRQSPGVQQSAQFADLLPAVIALKLKEIAANPDYTVTIDGPTLTAELRHNGETALRTVYLFDAQGAPLKIAIESNIGQLSEQTVDVKFAPAASPQCEPLSEERLISLWPDVFGKFRQSNFRIENLRGEPLPQIALPRADGSGRYTHLRGDAFRRPTFVAILDPAQGFTAQTVEALRSGADAATAPADLVFAFTGTSADAVSALMQAPRDGETVLLNADNLALSLGAAQLPVVLVCGKDGRVSDVISGFSTDLPSIVISHIESTN